MRNPFRKRPKRLPGFLNTVTLTYRWKRFSDPVIFVTGDNGMATQPCIIQKGDIFIIQFGGGNQPMLTANICLEHSKEASGWR